LEKALEMAKKYTNVCYTLKIGAVTCFFA